MTPSPGSSNQADAHTLGGAARTRGDMLRLTVNGVIVRPPRTKRRRAPSNQPTHPLLPPRAQFLLSEDILKEAIQRMKEA